MISSKTMSPKYFPERKIIFVLCKRRSIIYKPKIIKNVDSQAQFGQQWEALGVVLYDREWAYLSNLAIKKWIFCTLGPKIWIFCTFPQNLLEHRKMFALVHFLIFARFWYNSRGFLCFLMVFWGFIENFKSIETDAYWARWRWFGTSFRTDSELIWSEAAWCSGPMWREMIRSDLIWSGVVRSAAWVRIICSYSLEPTMFAWGCMCRRSRSAACPPLGVLSGVVLFCVPPRAPLQFSSFSNWSF